ncbi:MAG: HYR domain-containing protein [Saprospiraceae bacterium]|nr:HYR domain-containing protein [Saprospiraceae bacterium]
MQKPILMLYTVIVACIGTVLYASQRTSSSNNVLNSEGLHPKSEIFTINCPSPVVLVAGPNCMATVVVNVPVSTCGNITSLSYTPPGGTTVVLTPPYPPTIDLGMYLAGNYIVVWQVADNCPPLPTTATCNQPVVITLPPPTITCPATVNVNADSGFCFASQVALGTAVTGAACSVASVTPRFNNVVVTNSTQFPVGSNVVTWTVTDITGATATCQQSVVVNDNQPPVISCPINITANTSPGLCASIVNYTAPIGTDNCPGANTLRTTGLASGSSFPLGITTNTFVVTAANGTTASCSFTVNVLDNQAPSVTCPLAISVNNNPGLCYATNVNLGTLIRSDNCMVSSFGATLNNVPIVPLTQFPVGINTVIWTVTDQSNNTATCTQIVTVTDNQNPTIICPLNLNVNANNGSCFATGVVLGSATTSDNCGVQTTISRLNNVVTTNLTQYPVGINTVIWTVTDVNGRTATCAQTVIVTDNQNPTITCPLSITVNANLGVCYASNVNLGTAATADNCGIASTISRFSGAPTTPTTQYPVGTTNSVIWTVTDVNSRTATCVQNVTVIDNQAPSITCPANQTVSLNNSCNLVVPSLTALPIRMDNCSPTTITQSPTAGTIITSFHNQTNMLTYTVTDAAGLTATCAITMTSKDVLGPDIACKGLRIISLSDFPELPASSFIQTAVDNCGGPVTYSARRMGNICGGNTPDDLGNYVEFCCNDVNQTITIIVRVTDQRNNFTECMTTVTVQDKVAPIITPGSLPDVSISCEYVLNLNNLNAFGTLVSSGSPRQNIVIADPGNPFYPTGIAGQDGVYTDNCPGSVVTNTIRNLLTMCNTGQIKRDFKVTDLGGNTATYTQTIYVIDVDKFDISDITWPIANVDYNNCNDPDPDTSVTGAPVLNIDHCNQVGATYEDQTFSHPGDCSFIKRTWTVIDWCQYQTNTPGSPGKWTFIQYITVKNTVAPVINAAVCRDITICTPNASCEASATFTATGTDDCLPVVITWKYKIDLDNNGGVPDISGTGATFTRQYNIGTHKITWEATDKCGNVSSCSFLVVIRDCKAPNALAMQGLAININMPIGNIIFAKDFNNFSSDNCTPTSQLKYSFSSDVNNTTRTYTCDSLGQKRIELWVTDLAGNQSRTITYVIVQDNQNLCGNAGNRVNINGKVYTENKINISDAQIIIDGGETEGYLMTDTSGSYFFKNLAKYNNYELAPKKDTNHLDGVTTLDLVMIQRHILGLKYLESPYKVIAADVNNSQSISAADLVELRKLVLGVESKFSKNTSWRFVDAAYTFTDPVFPWPFMEKLNYTALENNMTNSDFIAVKIGDVNGSAGDHLTSKTGNRNNERKTLLIDDVNIGKGVSTSIPIHSEDLNGLIGFQWTFELNQDLVYEGFEAVELPIKNDHIAEIIRDGKRYLTVSFDDVNGISKKGKINMFNILVRSKKDTKISRLISLNNDITRSVAYSEDEIESNIVLSFRVVKNENPSSVMQNHPNPFSDQTLINVTLQEKSSVTISIFDGEGIMVYRNLEMMEAGNQSITLTEKQFGNKFGVFFCKIKAKDLNEVIKILRIE